MGPEKVNQRLGFWIALAAVLLVTGSLYRWRRIDTRPPAWDQSVHLNLALDYRDFLLHGKPLTSSWASIYPPLYHLSLIPILSLGTPSESKAAAMNALYFVLLLWGLARIAKRLGAETADAACAGLLFAGYSLVFVLMHDALIDFPLTAWTVLSLALLLDSENFSRRRESLLWGLSAGLGVLFKLPFVFFFILPFLVMTLRGRQWKNASLAALTAGLVAMLWYGWQGPLFWRHAVGLAGESGVAEGDPAWTSLAGWWYYVRALHNQMGRWPLVFTLGGLAAFLFRKERRGRSGLIGWCLLSGYLVLTFIHNKDDRYTVPLLPLLALLAVAGYRSLLKGRAGRAIVAGAVLGLWEWTVMRVDPPLAQDWKHREIGEVLVRGHDATQPFMLVSVLSNHPYLFGRNLRWSLRAEGIPMETSHVGDPAADFTEFVITKSGDLGPSAESLSREWRSLEASGRAFSWLFHPVAAFDLPDGSRAVVYGRDPHPHFDVRPLSARALEEKFLALLKVYGEGIRVKIDAKPADLAEGRTERVQLHADAPLVRGIVLPPVDVDLTGARFNLYRVYDRGEAGLLAFESIHVRMQLSARDVERVLNERVKGLSGAEVHFRNGMVTLRAIYHGIPLGAEARVGVDARHETLTATVTWLKVFGIPVPGCLFGKIHRQAVPLYPIPPFPGRIDVGGLRLDDDLLILS